MDPKKLEKNVLEHGFVRLVDMMPFTNPGDWAENQKSGQILPGDKRIVDAARVSIAGAKVRPTSEDEKLIRYLLKNRHTTPFEQVRFTFHCRMPIFVARQWIRHRTGSFNEESARYGQLKGDMYVPALSRMQVQSKNNKQGSGAQMADEDAKKARDLIDRQNREAYQSYERLLEMGVARELARSVLPLNIFTQWYWTTDLHNLFHFLKLRLHPHAQYETRVYAEAILPMAEFVAPIAVQAFRDFILEETC